MLGELSINDGRVRWQARRVRQLSEAPRVAEFFGAQRSPGGVMCSGAYSTQKNSYLLEIAVKRVARVRTTHLIDNYSVHSVTLKLVSIPASASLSFSFSLVSAPISRAISTRISE